MAGHSGSYKWALNGTPEIQLNSRLSNGMGMHNSSAAGLEFVRRGRVLEGDVIDTNKKLWWESLHWIATPGAILFHQRVGSKHVYIRTYGSKIY
ncbi:hypothetical protein AXG93_4448s1460 [Marchantia polymorpha subsp. ruderalis]|uniref:Uncharacterized protein n=1 Tax=Marchantia polymorpha subsp. ruderalis TaxID=1480154 RepID=A0A176VCS6_MARPO|nr:hypothetical protein AXG93_4448s1460 [Marchantia polymorpha subsp. ruderalis]